MAFDGLKQALFPKSDDTSSIEDESYDVDAKSVPKAGSKMVLVEPRAYSESQTIADHLKGRNSVVVNLKRVTNDQAKRIIDFLSGVAYANGGKIKRVSTDTYVVTPCNVDLEGEDYEMFERFNSKLDECEDVQKVYHNVNVK